jgi:membrane-associated phospholipid phosphatase
MRKLYKKLVPILSLIILMEVGCRKQDELTTGKVYPLSSTSKQNKVEGKADSYIAQSWYNLALTLVQQTPSHTPPIAARSFAYMGITLYESLVGEMQHNHSLVGQLTELNSIPQRTNGNSYEATTTANAALARIVRALFSNVSASNMSKIDALESTNQQLHVKQTSQEIFKRSQDYGRAVADAVFSWSQTDGGDQAFLNNFPTDYIPPTGIDKWIPTPPAHLSAMLPYWGNNRVMVPADNAGPVDPPNPPTFSTAPGSFFSDYAREVYNTVLNLTAEQNTIALYWADAGNTFTPPGHNVAITLQVIRNNDFNLYEAAVLLAKVGIALNDGGIVCWRAKYIHNLIRPITYIQEYIDPTWNTLIPTPPFPTYTSGHSTFSGATAGILTADIGGQVPFTDSSKVSYGFSPRSFNYFNAYAQEAAISRLYGGIHYRFDNENGFVCGQLVAVNVENINW